MSHHLLQLLRVGIVVLVVAGLRRGRLAHLQQDHKINKLAFRKSSSDLLSNEPSCKDGNVRFSTVPLYPYLINNVKDIVIFLGLKCSSVITSICFPAIEMRNSFLYVNYN